VDHPLFLLSFFQAQRAAQSSAGLGRTFLFFPRKTSFFVFEKYQKTWQFECEVTMIKVSGKIGWMSDLKNRLSRENRLLTLDAIDN
jgi:hypothetical protein